MRYPVSFAQRRWRTFDQCSPADPAAHLPYAVRLDGPVDRVALQRAVDVLVARHAALRTAVVPAEGVPTDRVPADGEPEQVVEDTGGVPVEHAVLTEGEAESFARELAARPFDLARGPLLRVALVETGPDRSLLVLVAHRIVADEAALAVLLGELSTVYRNSEAVLPRLWMDYGDYAVWQLDWLSGEELARQLDHWRGPLRGAPRELTMPTDRPRRNVRSTRGAVATAAIDPAVVAEIVERATVCGTDLSTAVLAGYAVVLSRYARQEDVVIGLPVDGRVRPELVPIVGAFADTVPLRLSVGGDLTFAGLLDQVRRESDRARSHAELPYGLLAEELGLAVPAVRFGGPPALPAPDFPGVTAGDRITFPTTNESDLDLVASDDGTLALGYRTDLFHAPFATRLVRSVVTVVEHAVRAPDVPIVDLPLLSAAESEALTGSGPLPENEFDVLAAVRESTATVTDSAGTVLMAVVRDRAARLAGVLTDHGVGPDTRVGVCVGRGTGLLTALLGVWWAGGAIVPLDPDHPLPWLEEQVRDAGPRLVVADDDHAAIARSLGEVVTLSGISAEPVEPAVVDPDSSAYSVFASRTRVDVTHRAVADVLAALRRALGLGADDRFVAGTTATPDLALLELLVPLVCGADLVIAGEGVRDGDGLRALVERSAATALHATSDTWRLLAGRVPTGLRLRLCTGELDRALADSLTAPDTALWHLYGHAESAGWAAATRVGPGPVLVGPPFDHHRLHVLDDRGAPVPIGVVGRVHVTGVATGELGRWREDGRLELLGRADHRVTVRGVRVDCADVEAALLAHDTVREAAVVGVPWSGDPALVAYVVADPQSGPRPDPAACAESDPTADVRDHLRATLPEAMVPALVVALDELDRDALPEPEWPAGAGDDRVPPRDPVEADMVAIWAELLDAPGPIGVHDNLFRLGGGSLTAMRFAARIADTYGVSLPMHSIVATPTIARLAEIVSAEVASAEPAADEAPVGDRDADLVALSDDELDDLLRAVLADRDRRRRVREDGR